MTLLISSHANTLGRAIGFACLIAGVPGLVVASEPVLATMAVPAAVQIPNSVSNQDAYVTRDEGSESWTLGSASIAYTVGFDRDGRLMTLALSQPGSATAWNPMRIPDSHVTVGERDLILGNLTGEGFKFDSANLTESSTGVELRLAFLDTKGGVRATRVYACYPASPVIEAWTIFEATGAPVILSKITGLEVGAVGTDAVWVHGLWPQDRESFSIDRQLLPQGAALTIDTQARSTETALPLFAVRSPAGMFFGGVMWSGTWRITLTGEDSSRVSAVLSPGDLQTTVTTARSVELPHSFFGITSGDLAQVSAALQSFIVTGVRKGRPFQPQVTFNTWFINGTDVNDEVISQEIDQAAAAGAELFELDAGWYVGAGANGAGDFSSGLGNWTVDPAKFKNGLRPHADHAHALGMKFALWVEPERIDLSTLGKQGNAMASWLASVDGQYAPGSANRDAQAAQLDFGNPTARQWVIDRLSSLVSDNGVDYLKWDNNFWINNNRANGEHGTTDGNFAHVRGLYTVLATLRTTFPDLLIENCAGGGNRLDLGLMQYTDAAWMDDHTTPAAHVRHNLEGLATFLPPSYLLSYVIAGVDEPMHDAPDLDLYARSRMPGVLGLSFRADELDPTDMSSLREEVDLYRQSRGMVNGASAVLLTDQAMTDGGPAWDALQLTDATGDAAVIYAFQNDRGVTRVTLTPQRLTPGTLYQVRSATGDDLGTFSGADLMTDGIEVNETPASAAHILYLSAQSGLPEPTTFSTH
jgi:alpha-galactosidase